MIRTQRQYKYQKLTQKQLKDYIQSGDITRTSLYKRVPLSLEQQKQYYDHGSIEYNIPLPKKTDKKPFTRERKVDKDFHKPLTTSTDYLTKRLEKIKNLPQHKQGVKTHFIISIGYKFGTEESNALDQFSVNQSYEGIKSLDDVMAEHEHLIPADMKDYDGVIKYIAVSDNNYEKPLSSFFSKYDREKSQWIEY